MFDSHFGLSQSSLIAQRINRLNIWCRFKESVAESLSLMAYSKLEKLMCDSAIRDDYNVFL